MDPRLNPYAPGAGTPPPELAGRDDLIDRAEIALDRLAAGRPSRGFVLYGLRGVGKTVLLHRIRQHAERSRMLTVWLEVPEDGSLISLLAPALRAAILKASRGEALRDKAKKALRVLSGFVRALKITAHDVEVSLDYEPFPGLGDSGDLQSDLTDLMQALGEAAEEAGTAVVIFIDEIQYVPERQLAAVISALHAVGQHSLPVTLVAAGLPQLLGRMGKAKSYAERLFEFVPVGPLADSAARDALCLPAEREGAAFTNAAVDAILRNTLGYPYFLQEWGKHSWDIARASPIEGVDAERATETALATLDASFFRVRFDRLTPAEKRYLRAMAELGPGPHRSGDIAEQLGAKVTTVAPTRNALINKGMVYSPAHGDTAFTVPLFDGFMKRVARLP